jgi:hypothetical protein
MLGGGIFALFQLNFSEKLKKAEFLDKIINIIRFDKENAETMYIIDYESGWYKEEFHHSDNDDLEWKIDKLLSYCDYVCYLYSTKNITEKEFRILEYEINRICSSRDAQAYLWNLYHFSKKRNSDCSYMYIINYGIKKKIIADDFKSNSKNLFEKRLNF